MKSVKVILLNYNNPYPTIKLVESLLKQEQVDLSIIVVDNCSPDNSYVILSNELNQYEKVQVLKSLNNGGYASGNNFGLHNLDNINDKDYVAILNNDLIIEDKLLFSKLIDEHYNTQNIGFIAPAQKDSLGDIYSHSAWRKPSFFQDLMMSFWIYRKFIVANTYNLNTDTKKIPVEILPGSFLLTTYKHFKDIEFFDEGTFLFLEERILYDKTVRKNKQNYLLKDVFYLHEGSSTIDQELSNVSKYKILYDSLLYYTKKYRSYGYMKSLILWPFLKYSLLELQIINKLKKLKAKF